MIQAGFCNSLHWLMDYFKILLSRISTHIRSRWDGARWNYNMPLICLRFFRRKKCWIICAIDEFQKTRYSHIKSLIHRRLWCLSENCADGKFRDFYARGDIIDWWSLIRKQFFCERFVSSWHHRRRSRKTFDNIRRRGQCTVERSFGTW